MKNFLKTDPKLKNNIEKNDITKGKNNLHT